MLNKNLSSAKSMKNDEFYTFFDDIAQEVQHYSSEFAGKTVYCNCDHPQTSNFTKYFFNNFHQLKLKKLITTGHGNVAGQFSEKNNRPGVLFTYGGAAGTRSLEGFTSNLRGSGAFASEECLAFLAEADIVVTNPPFSLYKEFLQLLTTHKKKFLIVGNFNSVGYKDVFSMLKNDSLRLGYSKRGMSFMTHGGAVKKVNACWFTNMSHKRRFEKLNLTKKYNSQDYPAYDNCNAIEVSKVIDIPYDYAALMGVPRTFFEKYNHKQFEVVARIGNARVKGVKKFDRILIKHRKKTLITGQPAKK